MTPLPKYKQDQTKILCWRDCAHCGTSFPVVRKFPDARFCSRKCGLAATLPPDHNARVSRESAPKRGDAQRGRGAAKAYRKRDGQHEHRQVAEESIGRPLVPGEVVHHRDGDKQNNAPENLEVLPNQGEHAKRHDTLNGKRGTKPGTVITHAGRTQNISAWAVEAGLNVSTLSYRLRRGWSMEEALKTPPSTSNRVVAS